MATIQSRTAEQPLPTPLGPGSGKLARSRCQVDVSRRNNRGSHTVYRTGRFTNMADARRWAEAMRQPGERANVTIFAAHDGWRSHFAGSLCDTGWNQAT